MNLFFWLAVVFGILGVIFLQGLRKIPANPPHKGQGTLWGKRIPGKVYNEGWGFFPFFPYWFGFILVKVERITFEVISEKTRMADRTESRIPISITIVPQPELLIEYIDSGREEGVKAQLTGKIRERIREWASSPEEGPATWMELNQSQLEGVSVLIKQIVGNKLTKIEIPYAQEIPTWIWLRYFMTPRPEGKGILKNEKKWAEKDWARVREVLKKIEADGNLENFKEVIKKRRDDILSLRSGGGEFVLDNLGVKLERLNVGDIDVLGDVATQAEGQERENQQRQAEELELRFVRERIGELMEAPFNFTPAEARDLVEIERGKVVKAINDQKISLDATTAQIIATVLERRET